MDRRARDRDILPQDTLMDSDRAGWIAHWWVNEPRPLSVPLPDCLGRPRKTGDESRRTESQPPKQTNKAATKKDTVERVSQHKTIQSDIDWPDKKADQLQRGSRDHHKDSCFHHLSKTKTVSLCKGSFRNELIQSFYIWEIPVVTEIMIWYKRFEGFYLIA